MPPHVSARPRRAGRTELSLFLSVYLVYNLARWLFVGDIETAREHARSIVALEQSVGLAIERPVQDALAFAAANWLLSYTHLTAQFVVLPGALIWHYRRAPGDYRRLRATIVATWLIAIPIFALFPVAPPRLADMGVIDTVSQQPAVALTGRSTIFYNPLAAVPSLHVGFAVALGVALARRLRSRWARASAVLWGPLVALAVVATGNHYVLDIGAALTATALGFMAGRLPSRVARARARSLSTG
jgi:PAP2 superfamily